MSSSLCNFEMTVVSLFKNGTIHNLFGIDNNNNAVLGHYTMSQCPYKFTNVEK